MKSRPYEWAVSLFVAVVLGAQIATLAPNAVGRDIGGRYWPILTYDMYATANREGDIVHVYPLLDGVTVEGAVIPITKEDLGLPIWQYMDHAWALRANDQRAIENFRRFYKGVPLRELHVKNFPYKVTRKGFEEVKSEIMARISLVAEVGVAP